MLEPIISAMMMLEWIISAIIWLAAGPIDRRRIRRFFRRRGESVRAIRWAPLATGWMSNWYDRIYSVYYDDTQGVASTANCRTSCGTGVVIMTVHGELYEATKCV